MKNIFFSDTLLCLGGPKLRKIIILIPFFITCCSFSDDNTNIQSQNQQSLTYSDNFNTSNEMLYDNNSKYATLIEDHSNFELLEGTQERCMCLLCTCCYGYTHKKCQITWIKIKAKEILGKNVKPIDSLKNKLRYSYSVSPIKYNGNYSKYVMPLILFESLVDHIEVTSFKLTHHKDLDFNNKNVLGGIMQGIPKVEKSSENGYKNVYPYGILNTVNPTGGEELTSAFATLYRNGKWNFMEAEIKVKDTNTNQETTHKILLNSKLFYKFLKTVITKYPETTNANNKFLVPIN
ncbi:S2/P23 family protein [Borrelia anserina]|nr:S2/P23 family protein [Borrelia anserina]